MIHLYRLPSPISTRSNTNTENQVDWLAQADYILPTGSTGKIELGGKATVRILENSYDVQESPSEMGIYTNSWVKKHLWV